jgi:hypothetical protein
VSHACCCRRGEAPIHFAAERGHLSILEFLVARGANVHAQTKWVLLMSATTLLPVAAMLLMAAIEIAVACCVWLRVDDECCGCWLFDAGVIVSGAAAVCCVG